jgi:acyl-CoA reductase-like NAD-dependent aldehyde dehydrogenase
MTGIKLDVEKLQAPMRETHASGVNLSYEWRMQQLKTLQRLLQENNLAFVEALALDLGKDPFEAFSCEIGPLLRDLIYAIKNLKHWMGPKAVPSPFIMFPAFSYMERKPLSSPGVLIVGPFNYPVTCVLRPLIGVLAGGNPAVLKPSELCPKVSKVLKELVENYFEPGVVQVVLGEVPEVTALLEKPWGKVMFTGSGRVGSIVGQACAKTLTPTLLELGGKCPTVVDETVSAGDLQNVADRIIFAKLMNAGQTCIAPDTLFVHEKHARALCAALVRAIESQFGKDQKKGELGRIINSMQAKRVLELIQDAESLGSRLIHGGSMLCDVDTRYICPTLLLDPPASSRILHEEIFGPALPIVTFSS